MLYRNMRLRALAAVGLPVLPATFGLFSCDGSHQRDPETPTTTATVIATADPTASATASTTETPTASSAATATGTATAAPTATPTATAVAESWIPTRPGKNGPPGPGDPHLPTCPNGLFCYASSPPNGGAAAPTPFEACSQTAPRPGTPAGSVSPSTHTSFAEDITKQERKTHAGACCYSWFIPCPGGRALRDAGGDMMFANTMSRADWHLAIARIEVPASAEARESLGRHWAREAQGEHASIAAFARATLGLLAAGAPPDLVAATQRAAMDEVEHAKATFALASLYLGTSVGPGPLSAAVPAPATSPEAVLWETFREACVGESVAALALREAAQSTTDSYICETLNRIAADEERHAELAWQTAAWALRESGLRGEAVLLEEIRILEAELRDMRGETVGETPDLACHGVLSAGAQRAIRGRALAEVVLPCARALLAYATKTKTPLPSGRGADLITVS